MEIRKYDETIAAMLLVVIAALNRIEDDAACVINDLPAGLQDNDPVHNALATCCNALTNTISLVEQLRVIYRPED